MEHSWNISTTPDSRKADWPPRRTALIASGLNRYEIDICTLSKMCLAMHRWAQVRITQVQAQCTLLWKGLSANEDRLHRVCFAVKNELLAKLSETPVGTNARLMTWRIHLPPGTYITHVGGYVPCLNASAEAKASYPHLKTALQECYPSNNIPLTEFREFQCLGGQGLSHWTGVLGRNGAGKLNSNGLPVTSIFATRHVLIMFNMDASEIQELPPARLYTWTATRHLWRAHYSFIRDLLTTRSSVSCLLLVQSVEQNVRPQSIH